MSLSVVHWAISKWIGCIYMRGIAFKDGEGTDSGWCHQRGALDEGVDYMVRQGSDPDRLRWVAGRWNVSKGGQYAEYSCAR